jgi:hypothetical protein
MKSMSRCSSVLSSEDGARRPNERPERSRQARTPRGEHPDGGDRMPVCDVRGRDTPDVEKRKRRQARLVDHGVRRDAGNYNRMTAGPRQRVGFFRKRVNQRGPIPGERRGSIRT